MLIPLTLFLGAACLCAVLKSRPQEAAMSRFTTTLYRFQPLTGWHPSVPLNERYESVTVLPYHPRERGVKIVEISGERRELLYREVTR